MNFILVHIGDDIPDYAKSNVDHLLDFGFNVHFLTNNKNLNKINSKAVGIPIEELNINDVDYKISKTGNLNHDEFLTKTSLRFYLLNEYAKLNNLKKFFHIENDVFIIHKESINNTNNFLSKNGCDLCLVMDSLNRCVPSIMWFKDCQSTNKLWRFMSKNNRRTDMELLSDYFHLNRGIVQNFPIIVSSESIKTKEINYSNFYNELGCIFDGASIGQYLYGIDNGKNGLGTTGFINETSIFNPSDFSYEKTNGNVFCVHGDSKTPIVNIHMHCKQSFDYKK